MTKYYAYCDKHGGFGVRYDDPEPANEELSKHLSKNPGTHGEGMVKEEHTEIKNGKEFITTRTYKRY